MPEDKDLERASAADTRKTPRRRYLVYAACIVALAAAGGYAGSLAAAELGSPFLPAGLASEESQAANQRDGQAEENGSSSAAASDGEGHAHEWSAVYQLRDVAEKTHIVHHDAEYGTETAYETVCNVCDEVVTGATDEHSEKTGHSSFTTDVPIVNEVVLRDAYDETVVDEPASVELVHTADRCTVCGEERDVDDVVVQTIDGTSDDAQD